jgi:hypothetical protein
VLVLRQKTVDNFTVVNSALFLSIFAIFFQYRAKKKITILLKQHTVLKCLKQLSTSVENITNHPVTSVTDKPHYEN